MPSFAGAADSSDSPAPTDIPAAQSAKTSPDANTLKVTTKAELSESVVPTDTLPARTTPQDNFFLAPKPDSQVARRLWQSRISVPAGQDGKSHIGKLQHLIQQVRSVRFRSKDRKPAPIIDVQQVPVTEADKASAARITSGEPVEKPVQLEGPGTLPYEPVSKQTLQMLEKVSQHPDTVSTFQESGWRRPAELGDILFLSGHLEKAAVFYQQALGRVASDDAASAENRAWILFQLGNCLRAADPPAARKTYRQLIAEHPNSRWADLAKAWEKLIDWYLKDKPLTLIEKRKS